MSLKWHNWTDSINSGIKSKTVQLSAYTSWIHAESYLWKQKKQ